MTPLELIEREVVRIRTSIAELQAEHDELETAMRVILRLTVLGAKDEPPRVFRMELHAESPAEPECIIDVSRAPALAEAVDALRESTSAGPELLARVREEARNRGLTITACSREIFGNGSQLYSLKDGRERDMSRARQWLGEEAPARPSKLAQRIEKPTPDFEAQVERVSRGEVRIGPAFHPTKPIDRTLGGVTGEIL